MSLAPLLRRSLAATGLALALGSCGTTPTLPLPPPIATVGAPNLQGLVLVEGQANENAFVTVFNQISEHGKIARAADDGHFAIDIEAQPGDTLSVWQESDGVESEHAEHVVPSAP
ncbi:MAG TPA: hypothetical protein VI299_21420 [Polyangiales bacterium]